MIVSIVFPIFNGLNYTKIGLRSLFDCIDNSGYSNYFEVIIIDDGSTDGSADWIRDNYPQVHLIKGSGNLWWSGGMNMGLEYAFNKLKSNYVLCWNNDIVPAEDYLIKLLEILNNHDGESLICSKIFYEDSPDKIFAFGCYFSNKNGKITINGNQMVDDLQFNKIIQVDWSGGMGLLISNKIFNKIQYFNSRKFPQYKGDADYCLRSKEAGFKMYAHPSLRIWNDVSSTGLGSYSASIPEFFRSFTAINSNYNFFTYYKFIKRHSNKPMAYFFMLRRFFFYIVVYFFKKIKY